jgi:translocation and assembly module TamB
LADVHFGGDQPIGIARGQLTASGVLLKYHSTLEGSLQAQGIGAGRLFLGQAAANARLEDGVGHVTATLAGRRGSRFELQLAGDIGPGQVAVIGHGIFAGQSIAMPRRAVFSARPEAEGGGWSLAPSQIDFGQGRAIASGVLGNGTHELSLALADMPLALGDVVFTDLGLGGFVSGMLHFSHPRERLPSGEVRLLVRGLTRSGLAVTSRPIDLALAGNLAADRLETRAIASDNGLLIGRLEASIAGLPSAGRMIDRLRAGRLLAQMRYQGPSDAPWRLMGMDELDLTGPIAIAANIAGSIDAPVIRGSLASDALHLQSAATGTDITQVKARGIFSGSQLTFNTLAGQTAGGGQVAGSGSINFAGITDGRRPGIDLTLATRKAQLASRADLALTATGPMRIISDGLTGTIAGRVVVDNARWRLGLAQAAAELPNITVHEINRSADVAPASVRHTTWRFLVDLAGRNKIHVIGLGLDSEWAANLHLRGTLRDPTLDGTADLVGGSYEFAGARFSLTRGRIIFTDSTSSDPRLDIAATANITGLAATVTVHGTSLRPQISFSSVPPLPEEEVLSRLLFDESVDKISAPEAVQLGAALTTLHGGGGLDPITRVRSAIGLDRLRIVGPDPTLGRQTGVAAGKYIGRRFYAEVMSDGHGYSATNLEFRVSRWLSLLGSVSTVGDQSVNVRASKDY